MEAFLSETIGRYQRFNAAVATLLAELHRLSPELLQRRCQDLAEMQAGLNEAHFFSHMEFFGPALLNTAALGEFQRVIDLSVHSCDALHAELLTYREGVVTGSGLDL